MRIYTQLTREHRYKLSVLLKIVHNQSEIAKVLGVHKSTVRSRVIPQSWTEGLPTQASSPAGIE